MSTFSSTFMQVINLSFLNLYFFLLITFSFLSFSIYLFCQLFLFSSFLFLFLLIQLLNIHYLRYQTLINIHTRTNSWSCKPTSADHNVNTTQLILSTLAAAGMTCDDVMMTLARKWWSSSPFFLAAIIIYLSVCICLSIYPPSLLRSLFVLFFLLFSYLPFSSRFAFSSTFFSLTSLSDLIKIIKNWKKENRKNEGRGKGRVRRDRWNRRIKDR